MRGLLLLLLLHAAALPGVAADQRFLAFGDSITVGHGDPGVICPDNTRVGGYPPRLQSRLAARGIDAEFLNFGFCGEKTSAGITRIESVLEQGGDVIVIMEGTNDINTIGIETTLFNLGEMAGKAELAGIEPVFASVIPQGPEAIHDPTNVLTQDLAIQLGLQATAAGLEFADPFHAFFDMPDFFDLFYFDQLHPNPTGYGILSDSMVEAAVNAATRSDLCAQVPPGPCVASSTVLCLNQGRFRLNAVWEDYDERTGVAQTLPQTDDTGAFYWLNPENVELNVKVLDGREFNGRFWVFYGALSSLEYSLVVTDTETGECKEYFNPLDTFASVGDTEAF